jgi:hypothetical protein
MTVLILVIWPGFIWLSAGGAFSRGLSISDVLIALLWASGAFVLLLIWLYVRAKTSVRTLGISAEGIHTEIGRFNVDYPWSKVKQVKEAGSYILIVNWTGNAFFIPERAFENAVHKSGFLSEIAGFRAASN